MNTTQNTQKVTNNDCYTLLATVGDIVRFKYKGGRKVCGKVLYIDKKTLILRLETDYIGRNVEWFKGEEKHFNIKECNKFRVSQL